MSEQEKSVEEQVVEEKIEEKKEEIAEIKLSRDALNDRLKRAKTKASKEAVSELLGELGFSSREELIDFRKSQEEKAKAEEEARRKEMTELEALRADLEAERKAREENEVRASEEEQRREAAELKAHLNSVCASKGITNTSYAFFKIEEELMRLEDGEELDEVKFLDELLSDETQKIALGIRSPEMKKPTTVITKDGPDPKPQVEDKEFDAATASKEQVDARLAQLGFHR